jgi:hypothetical protein
VQGQFPKISRISQIYTTKTKKFPKNNSNKPQNNPKKKKEKRKYQTTVAWGTSTQIILFVKLLKFSIKIFQKKKKLQRKIEDLLKLFKNILFPTRES